MGARSRKIIKTSVLKLPCFSRELQNRPIETFLNLEGMKIVVAVVKWQLRNENKSRELPVTDTTLAGIRREGKDRGRGQVDGLDWQAVERVCAFAKCNYRVSF